ncbi:MAG: hypothetical protein AB2A00_09070, partial [Myxococcota bacterium]
MAEDLGTWLVREGKLSADKLEEVYQRQVIYGGTLDTNILEMGLCSEADLLGGLCAVLDLPPATREDLLGAEPDKLKLFPAKLAQKYALAPFKLVGRNLSVAMPLMPDAGTLDDIGFMLSVYLKPHAALELRVHQTLLRLHGTPLPARLESLMAQLGEDPEDDRKRHHFRMYGPEGERWVTKESARLEVPTREDTSSLPPEVLDGGWQVVRAGDAPLAGPTDGNPELQLRPARALGGFLPGALTDPPPPAPVLEPLTPAASESLPPLERDPPSVGRQQRILALQQQVDPEMEERIRRRAEKVTWRLADARAEFALAANRDEVVEVLL